MTQNTFGYVLKILLKILLFDLSGTGAQCLQCEVCQANVLLAVHWGNNLRKLLPRF